MARTVFDSKLGTRTARGRLPQRREPYWRAISAGLAIGYRRGKSGGAWIARHYASGIGRRSHALGKADDIVDADGVHVLSFDQAQERARNWFRNLAITDDPENAPRGPYRVSEALENYFEFTEARRVDRNILRDRKAAAVHIVPELGHIEVQRLTTRQIATWHNKLAKAPRRVRSKPGKPIRYAEPSGDPDAARRRRSTANRILTILKAALNQAWRNGKVDRDDAWRKVQPFHNVDTPKVRFLTEEQCGRLVNACPTAFRQLVLAGILTGCRYGELTRLQVHDYDPDSGTLSIRMSKNGKARHITLTSEGRELLDQAVAGKQETDLIFVRTDSKAWGPSHQDRPMRLACSVANIEPPISFHDLRHTHASLLARRGVPLQVIASQLGHADTRMTEKHYAHLCPNYVAETIRANFPRLGVVSPSNVVPIKWHSA